MKTSNRMFVAVAIIFGGLIFGAEPATAQAGPVQLTCDNDLNGSRKATKCQVSQPQLGMTWKGSAVRARKLYINKPEGDSGQEIVRWWANGGQMGDVVINPGFNGNIFKKKHQSTILVRVEIETVKLPTSGASRLYFHFETLDRPQVPDLSSCSNTVSADRTSVCYSGNFD